MGGLADAGAWGLAWAMVAAVASSLAIVAALLLRLRREREPDWHAGYDAMAAFNMFNA
ncbi:MAG: hypothetical protein ABUS48_06665 [Pseudomonadota bacterium]